VIAQAVQQPATRSGLRPLNPLRDLRQVADLIELAFSEELSLIGREYINEMRQAAKWGPLLLLLGNPDPFLSGFVWEEDSRIVANVTLGRARAGSRDWVISNVAVHPAYRRRGIARRLLEETLDAIAAHGGQMALLQVRAENEAARQLYRDFGFTHYHTRVELRCQADSYGSVTPPEGLAWRGFRARDRREVRKLLQAATPVALRRFKPAIVGGLGPDGGGGWSDWLDDFMERRRTRRLVVEEGDRIVAFLQAQARLKQGSLHRLYYVVHPERRGMMEKEMVQQGVSLLSAHPGRAILMSLPADDKAGLAAATAWGFREMRRLEHMKCPITPYW